MRASTDMNGSARGFTLIELLITAAILALLAAIGLANFLEVQARSKVSRTLGEFHHLRLAIEAYCLDHDYYPLSGVLNQNGTLQNPHLTPQPAPAHKFFYEALTTPVAYFTTLPLDPFVGVPAGLPADWAPYYRRYFYTNLVQFAELTPAAAPAQLVIAEKIRRYGDWILCATGPDGDRLDLAQDVGYDPTNGTVSNGDVIRSQKRHDY